MYMNFLPNNQINTDVNFAMLNWFIYTTKYLLQLQISNESSKIQKNMYIYIN